MHSLAFLQMYHKIHFLVSQEAMSLILILTSSDLLLFSRASPGARETPSRNGPRFADRKGSRASVSQGEGGIKNPRAKALWDKWRHVWMMAWERDRRLKDKLNYLQELEKVKNFDWEAWRKKYLKHHNNKKSRVQDFFRKLDDDGDGYCPRDEFIDGILRDKFATSKLEMNAVADKFDHGDGMIDWREFMIALRPDWEDRGPLTDTQRIDDEIKRQVAQCTCRQKFKVFQVGEGKYRVSRHSILVSSISIPILFSSETRRSCVSSVSSDPP